MHSVATEVCHLSAEVCPESYNHLHLWPFQVYIRMLFTTCFGGLFVVGATFNDLLYT